MSLNKDMGNDHEEALYLALGGRKTQGSGNQWTDPADGRNSVNKVRFPFAWDGKSTYGKSMSISVAMWEKIVDQAGPEAPMIGLRFYDPEQGTARMAVKHDLAVIKLSDLAEMVWYIRRDGYTSSI